MPLRSGRDLSEPPVFESQSPVKAVIGVDARFHEWDKELKERAEQPAPGSYDPIDTTFRAPCAAIMTLPSNGAKNVPAARRPNTAPARKRQPQEEAQNIFKSRLLRPTASSLFRFPASPRSQQKHVHSRHRDTSHHDVTLAGPLGFGSSAPRPRAVFTGANDILGERPVVTPGPGYYRHTDPYGGLGTTSRHSYQSGSSAPARAKRTASARYSQRGPTTGSNARGGGTGTQRQRGHGAPGGRQGLLGGPGGRPARRTASHSHGPQRVTRGGFGSTSSRSSCFLDPNNPAQYG